MLASYMNEEWKDIAGYEGRYQVSSLGHVYRLAYEVTDSTGVVRSIRQGIQKQNKSVEGYYFIKIGKIYKNIHTLVAIAFLPKPRKGYVVTHLDGDRTNNHITNLKYVTKSKAWKLAQKRKSHVTSTEITIKETA